MNGIGEYTAYTPSFTNLTIGNGTATFRYGRVQKFIQVTGRITFGSTTSLTGNLIFSLPVTAVSADVPILGLVSIDDVGVSNRFGWVRMNSTTLVEARVWNSSGTYLESNAINATTPHTWNATDSVQMNFIYEAA
jgi:hypothetical protein